MKGPPIRVAFFCYLYVMHPEPSHAVELFAWASQQNLYADLLVQLQKDFQLGKIDIELHTDIIPEVLYQNLVNGIFRLLQTQYEGLLNLLYIIDVPESAFKQIQGDDLALLAQEISFLILRREWMKVWYKKNWRS